MPTILDTFYKSQDLNSIEFFEQSDKSADEILDIISSRTTSRATPYRLSSWIFNSIGQSLIFCLTWDEIS